MPLEGGTHDDLVGAEDEGVHGPVGPIDGQAGGVQVAELRGAVLGLVVDEAVAQLGPGDLVHPDRVRRDQLGGARAQPGGEGFVDLGGGGDLPLGEFSMMGGRSWEKRGGEREGGTGCEVGEGLTRSKRYMVQSRAIFSGMVTRAGRLLRSRVRTLETGWLVSFCVGLSRLEMLGFLGPTSSVSRTPSSASLRRSCMNESRVSSTLQVGGTDRIGISHA